LLLLLGLRIVPLVPHHHVTVRAWDTGQRCERPFLDSNFRFASLEDKPLHQPCGSVLWYVSVYVSSIMYVSACPVIIISVLYWWGFIRVVC
jgi:hypothetical protein